MAIKSLSSFLCQSLTTHNNDLNKFIQLLPQTFATLSDCVRQIERLLRLLNWPVQLITFVINNNSGQNVESVDGSIRYFDVFNVLSIQLEEASLATNISRCSLSSSVESLNSLSRETYDLNNL